ncbi:hypothetical protein CBR_g9028 [Chara braunii]|uniref:Integrase zinc-binding domain-containing protein n=1 Tax=Chara braunii TaxID=69332 RepID=A0A388KNI8_CHABU|nr:hypothetical protein CBR_g9028 [Chara braunii]|eukprot:GBG71612.1 hypothetical protein CBR_g9028 [Chara braunii]
MSQGGGSSNGPKKGLTLDDLIAAINGHERNPSNIPKVDTFHCCGERVSEWLERVEQALVGRSDVVKFQRILQYVLHRYHQEVKKVIDAVEGSWERFKKGMQRKYRLGDGLLTTADLEAMNKEDFTTIWAFVQEFKKRARKVHGISEEAQCAIFLGLLTASEAVELTRHGGGSTKLTWATIDRGVEVGCLDQVEQRQVRLQKQKRKERDATASGTPGVTRIVTYVLAQLGYATESVVQRRVVTAVRVKGKEPVIEEAVQEELWEEEEPVPKLLTKAQRKESLDQSGSLNPAGNVDEVPESQDDEFEEGEIKEVFRAEEYEGIYIEQGFLLSCEMQLRDASDRAQRMLQRYLVRDGHLFVRREVGNPRRVVCGRNHQVDVVAALHDGIVGGHRGVQATYAKISELYYWDEMMDMVGKFCRSCVPCQERSRLRQGEPLHPRLEREVGVVVHLDLLFMPLGDQGYNYIFDACDNLSGFVDGRAIRTKTESVLVSCIEEYYLRYPFVKEIHNGQGIGVYLPGGARTVIKAIERLRGAGRFEEPITRIRREATTRQEVETRMQELRPSPVGPDGRPIRLEIGNAADFIPAFEWFIQGQGIPRDEWARTLPLWTRKAERALAKQVRDMPRDWESCRAHLREAFRRPEPPQPRIERRQRSQRQRDPEPREARPSRGGRKALARSEEEPEPEPEAKERRAYPECGLGPVEFHRFTEGGLRRSPARTQEEPPASEGPLRELETHLNISRWRASPRGKEHGEQAEEVPREEVSREEVPQEEVPREEVPREEVQDTQRERGLGDEGRRAGKEVIEVGEDTPPQTPVLGLRLGDAPGSTRQAGERLQREEAPLRSSEKAPSPEGRAERRRERAAVRKEALTLIDRHLAAYALEHPDLEEPAPAEPRQEPCQPKKEMEAEIPKRVDLRTRERAPAGKTVEEKRAREAEVGGSGGASGAAAGEAEVGGSGSTPKSATQRAS